MAMVPHHFGQATPSVVAADYFALVKGATITTVDISANASYFYLGTFDCATNTFDYTGQNVITPAGVNALDLWQLAQDLYPVDVPAPSLDHDGIANLLPSLGNRERRDRQLLDTIFGIGDFAIGHAHGFGRTHGIVLNTDRAGYTAFNAIAGITEAGGTVTVVLSKNTIDNHECIFTQGAPCTDKTATDWTNYVYVPAGGAGYYCVYFKAETFVYDDATKGYYCEITTAKDAGAASPADAMIRKASNGYLPLYGYEINGGGAMLGEVAYPLYSIAGMAASDKVACQWETRNKTLAIDNAVTGLTASLVIDAPPTPSVEINFAAANDYCYLPINLPVGYTLNSLLVDIDDDLGAGDNNTVTAELFRGGASVSAAVSWTTGRAVKSVIPTTELVMTAPPGGPAAGTVYLVVILTVKAGGTARLYGVAANYSRCME
jgi:hypothetical protein